MRRLVHPLDLGVFALDLLTALQGEENRIETGAELIASESYPWPVVIESAGNVFTAKYPEGFPYTRIRDGIDRTRPARYYGGTEFYDRVELAAIDGALATFGLGELGEAWACVQPHSGTDANLKVWTALAEPGSNMLGLELFYGGHLSHGADVSLTGKLYNWAHYRTTITGEVDYDQMRELMLTHKPRVLVIGGSALITAVNCRRVRQIRDEAVAQTGVFCYIVYDIAHPAGFIARRRGIFANPDYLPWGFVDVVVTTTHKTLRGISGGLIIVENDAALNLHGVKVGSTDRLRRLTSILESAVFPGSTGKGLGNQIFAKAVGFRMTQTPEYDAWLDQTLANTRQAADTLIGAGIPLLGQDAPHRGTENHCFLVKVRDLGLGAKEAEAVLERAGFTSNVNTGPDDSGAKQAAKDPFFLRFGLPALTCREGWDESATAELMGIAADSLHNNKDGVRLDANRGLVRKLMADHPLYASA